MKVSWRLLSIGPALLCASTMAVPPNADRYQKISERNVFGLREPAPVEQPKTEPPPALAKVFLTGISTLMANKRALLTAQFPAKPGQPAREQSFMLAEGQRDEGIEVLSIDEKAKEVRIDNSGTVMTLNFEKDGL